MHKYELHNYLTETCEGSTEADSPWEALEELGIDPDEIEVVSHSPDKTSVNFVFRGTKYTLSLTRQSSREEPNISSGFPLSKPGFYFQGPLSY